MARVPNGTPTREDRALIRKHRRKRRGPAGAGGSVVGIRVAEIGRVFADNYGDALPDDDAGRDDLFVLLNHAAYYTDARPRMRTVACAWAPWLPADALDDLIADITARPLRWRADSLAKRLGVTDEQRTRLALRTIGAIDVTADERHERRKERDRLAKEAKRRAAGVPPRSARRSPWRLAGVSRRTWFRRRARPISHAPRALGTGGTATSSAYEPFYAADFRVPHRAAATA